MALLTEVIIARNHKQTTRTRRVEHIDGFNLAHQSDQALPFIPNHFLAPNINRSSVEKAIFKCLVSTVIRIARI
jgi:hypothetical protein